MPKFKEPTLSPEDYLELVAKEFLDKGDPIRAEQQRA